MPHETDYKKEWFAKAKVDYFIPFVTLWLACNSWYNFHYSLRSDREHVNKIKTDFSGSNKLYKKFERSFVQGDSKEIKNFLSLLELLHFSLVQAEVFSDNFHETKILSFENLLINFNDKSDPTAYQSVIIHNALTVQRELKANVQGVILSEQIVLSSDTEKVFAGLVEIIYQVRCMLVHGELSPTPENHEVVKYCYLVLFELMKDFCT